jgi:hypothetical protein
MEQTVRKVIKPIHSVIGKAFPVLGWTRMFSLIRRLCILQESEPDARNDLWRSYRSRLLPRG